MAKKRPNKEENINVTTVINRALSKNYTREWCEENKNKIEQAINVVWNTFSFYPQIVKYIDKHANSFQFNTYSTYDKMKFIEMILENSGLTKGDLRFQIPEFEKRQRYAKAFYELGSRDIAGLYALHKLKIVDLEEDMPKIDQSRPKKLSKEDKEKILKAKEEFEQQKLSNDDVFLPELTQEIIDELELTLYDVHILNDRNQVLYILIDKDNNKRYYVEPFQYQFRYHPEPSIIKKDYFVPIGDTYGYIIRDTRSYIQLRQALNNNFKMQYPFSEE